MLSLQKGVNRTGNSNRSSVKQAICSVPANRHLLRRLAGSRSPKSSPRDSSIGYLLPRRCGQADLEGPNCEVNLSKEERQTYNRKFAERRPPAIRPRASRRLFLLYGLVPRSLIVVSAKQQSNDDSCVVEADRTLLVGRRRLCRNRVHVDGSNMTGTTRIRSQLLDLSQVALHLAPAIPQRVIRTGMVGSLERSHAVL